MCGVAGAVHALGSARLAAHAGDGRRRKTAAEGLVQQYVYGAALDIHSVMIAALLLAYPTSPSAMVERAVGGAPTLGSAEVLQPEPLLSVAERE